MYFESKLYLAKYNNKCIIWIISNQEIKNKVELNTKHEHRIWKIRIKATQGDKLYKNQLKMQITLLKF